MTALIRHKRIIPVAIALFTLGSLALAQVQNSRLDDREAATSSPVAADRDETRGQVAPTPGPNEAAFAAAAGAKPAAGVTAADPERSARLAADFAAGAVFPRFVAGALDEDAEESTAVSRAEADALLAALAVAAESAPRATAPVALAPQIPLPVLVTSDGGTAMFVAAPPDDERLFIVQREGRIVILENGVVRATPFLDIQSQVGTSGEQGMLGMAFDPDFDTSGLVYVYYLNDDGDSVVSRFQLDSDPNVLDDTTEDEVLVVTQPDSRHNGGTIAFGADGMLYVGLGDGGSSNDPDDNAQDPLTLLGKMLRIDVSGGPGTTYTIPGDNPFEGSATVLEEIWAFGLRNPFRFSFDSSSGDLWIGDVGQGAREEIDFEPSTSDGGLNWGWDVREGSIANPATSTQTPPPYVNAPPFEEPIFDYAYGSPCRSVTGGSVYRGSVPALVGLYFFADWCTGQFWTIDRSTNPAAVDEVTGDMGDAVGERVTVAIAEGGFGELYVVHSTGDIFRIGSAGDECDDGLDNDGDGASDFPDDTGCSSADDPSEKDVDVDCDDGFDNDADGRIDFPDDCGCASSAGSDETANDPPGGCPDDDDDDDDGGGGKKKCGLGFELILLLPPLMAIRRRRGSER